MARRNAPVARYLQMAGYTSVPGSARRYVSPTGETVSRRQAEQQSGALQAIHGVPTREALTRARALPYRPPGIQYGPRGGVIYAPPPTRTRDVAVYMADWNAAHPDSPYEAAESESFWDTYYTFLYNPAGLPWSVRRDLAMEEFGWGWDEANHQFIYPSY